MRALLRAGRRKLLGLKLSVVIPTLNVADRLPACLQAIGNVDEIIVVDGGSSDDTVGIASYAGARVIAGERGRGVQLKSGGAAATGDWLLFLHADTRLSQGWREAMASHVRRHDVAGCFRLRLDDAAWQARLIERGVAIRSRLGLPYGDQGLLVSRSLYENVGGYRPLPLMEDVDLVRRLRPVRMIEADAITSAERWRRNGWTRRSARNLLCLGLYGAGMAPERIAKLYG